MTNEPFELPVGDDYTGYDVDDALKVDEPLDVEAEALADTDVGVPVPASDVPDDGVYDADMGALKVDATGGLPGGDEDRLPEVGTPVEPLEGWGEGLEDETDAVLREADGGVSPKS